ncbi:MAG: glycosyltransferase family 2 protein [Planctomycetota bacterium]|jgi:glycosyltransferase involved in cell wall biosynthesis
MKPETSSRPRNGPSPDEGGSLSQDQPDAAEPQVSVVVPMLNEEDNVVPLYEELRDVMEEFGRPWEVIFVDDGSFDDSVPRLLAASARDPRVTVLELTKRFGQTAALGAGFARARGQYIVPMDADLQNDPRGIPTLVTALEEPPGYDLASGWRKDRQDKFLTRRLPSMIANKLIARLTWTRIHDFGCTLKAYRREILEDVEIYGEMHRFLPAICSWRGAQITERVVNHRPRRMGSSKYGLRRTAKVLLDLVTVKFLGDYLTKPLYFFGKISLLTLFLSFVSLGVAVLQKFSILYPGEVGLNLNRNILVGLSVMLFLMTVMFVMMGVMSELLVRIYHESQGKKPYKIRRVTRGKAE